MVEVKERFKDLVDVQIVAFPQEGILSFPNGRELMKEALEIGADVVGGIPHYEYTRIWVRNPSRSFSILRKSTTKKSISIVMKLTTRIQEILKSWLMKPLKGVWAN